MGPIQPLDRHKGEVIGALGHGYRVVPLSNWMDTPFPNLACERAVKAFRRKGALEPIRFRDEDIVVQEYPAEGRLAFVFQRKVRGKLLFSTIVIKFPDETVRSLRLVGRWPAVQ